MFKAFESQLSSLSDELAEFLETVSRNLLRTLIETGYTPVSAAVPLFDIMVYHAFKLDLELVRAKTPQSLRGCLLRRIWDRVQQLTPEVSADSFAALIDQRMAQYANRYDTSKDAIEKWKAVLFVLVELLKHAETEKSLFRWQIFDSPTILDFLKERGIRAAVGAFEEKSFGAFIIACRTCIPKIEVALDKALQVDQSETIKTDGLPDLPARVANEKTASRRGALGTVSENGELC